MAETYRYIGKVLPRRDGREIVTGGTRYVNDLQFSNLLYGKVLRSPHPHALIAKVDKRRAIALPGVRAVLAWEDVPDWRGGTPRSKKVLDRKVRQVGDAVAPAPVRAETAEEFLSGRVLDEETASQAAELALSGARPLSRNAYKVVIAKTLIKRAILASGKP